MRSGSATSARACGARRTAGTARGRTRCSSPSCRKTSPPSSSDVAVASAPARRTVRENRSEIGRLLHPFRTVTEAAAAPSVVLPAADPAERPWPGWRETLGCVAATALVAVGVHLAIGQPGDAAAHLYRTFLVRHGILVWDNLWFAGQYPLASYSLLYYLPAAVLGNLPLVFAACVGSTFLFASIASREWGRLALWPTRAFAVLAAAPLFTGLYSWTLGVAAVLAALWLFQRRKHLAGLALAALALGFSPLAFLFLCLILASFVVGRLREWRRALLVLGGLALLASIQVVVIVVFPTSGVYPFHVVALLAVIGVSTFGVLVARRAGKGRPLEIFFALWAAGALVCFLVPTPLGDNWARLSEFLFPVMLLAATLAGFRPKRLVVAALVAALAYNLTPYFLLIPYRLDSRPASEAFWRPALRFLHTHLGSSYRVEVVPTAAHWESYWIPRAGFPLARGFYDQLDAVDDAAVYRSHVDPVAYVRWLRSLAVEYVLLASTTLDRAAGSGEAALLRSGKAGLPVVSRTGSWTIYRVPHPIPVLTGPARARVIRLLHTTIVGSVGTRGVYLLRVRYSPDLVLAGRSGCVARSKSSMTLLRLTRAGTFELRAIESPDRALDRALAPRSC